MAYNTTTGLNQKNINTIKQATFGFIAYSYLDYTVTSASTGITLPTDKPRMIHIYVESTTVSPAVAMRYRIDGGDPVATSVGIPKSNGDELFIYEFANIQKLRVIEEVGADTTILRITFYK